MYNPMVVIPFGEVVNDRFQTSKQYNLLEMVGGIYRLTQKAKAAYEPSSFVRFLQGKEEKPERLPGVIEKPVAQILDLKSDLKSELKSVPASEEIKSQACQVLINEILAM